MKIFKLILAIGFCSCTVAAPGVLTRRKRVSGYDDSGTNNDELMGDYDTDYSYDEDLYEEEEFTCTNENGEKVALYLMCDGFHDCLDGSDEVALNCEENGITPLSDTFVSATQSVTTPSPEPVKPDIVDIGDYDDYADACTEDEFQCSSDISICLPKLQVCDGVSDCPENEDEAECHGNRQIDNKIILNFTSAEGLQRPATKVISAGGNLCASINTFQCRSRPGDCVPRELLCDGFQDCADGSDEERCGCGFGKYTCLNGRCLDASVRCDGSNDCGDFSDEILGCILMSRNQMQQAVKATAGVLSTRTNNQNSTEPVETTAGDIIKFSTSASHATARVTPTAEAGICSLRPCANEGECIENGDSFVCVCTPQYTGPTCLQRANARKGSDFNSSSATVKFNYLLYICVLIVLRFLR